jgi:hypothetical protein
VTILAHLAERLCRQREFVATEGLYYLLSSSPAVHDQFVLFCRQLAPDLSAKLTFESQASAEDGCRPDIIGRRGDEPMVVVEGKFDADLTDYQRGPYLGLLGTGGLLLFVVPERRKEVFWLEVSKCYKKLVPDGKDTKGTSDGKTIVVRSWRELLAALPTEADPPGCDLLQLRGLTELMDEEAFVPLTLEQLRDPSAALLKPIYAVALIAMASAAHDSLLKLGRVSGRLPRFKGVHGYCSEVHLWLGYTLDWWEKYRSSPLWLQVYEGERPDHAQLKARLRNAMGREPVELGSGDIAFPILVHPDKDKRDVIRSVLEEIGAITQVIRARPERPPQAEGLPHNQP